MQSGALAHYCQTMRVNEVCCTFLLFLPGLALRTTLGNEHGKPEGKLVDHCGTRG